MAVGKTDKNRQKPYNGIKAETEESIYGRWGKHSGTAQGSEAPKRSDSNHSPETDGSVRLKLGVGEESPKTFINWDGGLKLPRSLNPLLIKQPPGLYPQRF